MFSFGGEWGEFKVLLDSSKQGHREFLIRIFYCKFIFATHLVNRITKLNCFFTPSSIFHLVYCIESLFIVKEWPMHIATNCLIFVN